MNKKVSYQDFALCSKCCCPPPHHHDVVQRVFTTEQISVEGRLLNRLVEKTVNRQVQEKPNKVSDFCLENQIAAGSVGLNSFRTAGADILENSESRISAATAALDAAAAAAAKSESNE